MKNGNVFTFGKDVKEAANQQEGGDEEESKSEDSFRLSQNLDVQA